MVGLWGMSETIGPVAVVPEEPQTPYQWGETSQVTAQRVDEEVRRIVEDARDEVARLLADHRDKLDALAQALLAHETLDEEAAYAAAGIEHEQRTHERPVPAK